MTVSVSSLNCVAGVTIAMSTQALQSIPLIDISDTADTTHEIEKACHDIGFMYIVGHGIAPKTKDTDALIILAPDPVGGLMVRCRAGQETPHKVVNSSSVSREVWRTNWPDVTTNKPHFYLGTLEN